MSDKDTYDNKTEYSKIVSDIKPLEGEIIANSEGKNKDTRKLEKL